MSFWRIFAGNILFLIHLFIYIMSVNKVILIGNAGRDPEVRYLDNNRPVANFTLATTERGYTTQNGINVPERTEWHRIVVFGGLAKVVENYVRKGTQVYLEGKIQYRTWTDKEQKERQTTEIVVDELQLLGRKGDNNRDGQEQQSRSFGNANNTSPAASQVAVEADDDLPF